MPADVLDAHSPTQSMDRAVSTPLSIPALERPAFFNGQLLESDDLSAMYDFHREMRWLHNRSLHGWGIAIGFAVTGNKGDRVVTIRPGYAIDCLGHDLVLSRPQSMQIPPLSGAATGGPARYYLTASYIADADLAPDETRDGTCGTDGAVRRMEQPLLRWQDPNEVAIAELRYRRGLDIVLASIDILDCALVAAPSKSQRRSARVEPQPYVRAGISDAGGTVWSYFYEFGAIAGVQATIDTTAAAFGTTPSYVANLVGSRMLSAGTRVVDGLLSVSSPTPANFVARVTMPHNLKIGTVNMNPDAVFNAALLTSLKSTLQWCVSWIGMEG